MDFTTRRSLLGAPRWRGEPGRKLPGNNVNPRRYTATAHIGKSTLIV
jgi:hypothetical protein